MLGRVIGVLAGLVFIAIGVGLWRPELVPHGVVLGVGPFEPYKSAVSGLMAAVGAVVAIAALQRPRASRARRSPGAAAMHAPGDPPGPGPGHPVAAEVVPEPHAQAIIDEVAPAQSAAPLAAPAAIWFAPTAAAGAALDRSGFAAATDAGDHFRMQGAFDDAMDHYSVALSHARAEHDRHPGDSQAQSDLAAALTNVADVYDEQGRVDRGLEAHEESLTLRRQLAAAAPSDKAAQRGLSLGLERLADAREARGHRTRALDLYRESLPIAEQLAAAHPDDAVLVKDLATTRENVAALEAKLA
jgi:hypothetical protein